MLDLVDESRIEVVETLNSTTKSVLVRGFNGPYAYIRLYCVLAYIGNLGQCSDTRIDRYRQVYVIPENVLVVT